MKLSMTGQEKGDLLKQVAAIYSNFKLIKNYFSELMKLLTMAAVPRTTFT
jgi:predicted DNA-binding helix-hairpin-helix protein